jgi:hypothetical protein
VYFQLRKMSCGFKDQARICPSGEKYGLHKAHSAVSIDATNLGEVYISGQEERGNLRSVF